jgi:hypothetical protein
VGANPAASAPVVQTGATGHHGRSTDMEGTLSSGQQGVSRSPTWDELWAGCGRLGVGGTARAKGQSFDGPVRLIFEGWVPHNR